MDSSVLNWERTDMGEIADQIKEKLQTAFAPVHLVVTDDSAKHRGHVGSRPEGQTHFTVDITSTVFVGHSRVAQQRMVYKVLDDLMDAPIHALALHIRTPS